MDTMGVVVGEHVEPPIQQVEPGKVDQLDRSENPVAELAVKGGTLTAEEIDAVRDMLERDAVVLRDAGGAPGLEAIRRVFGTAASVPCNWHQATIFFLGSENPADAAMKGKARLMLFAGLILIIFQVLTACGVIIGVSIPACKTSKHCGQPGTYCVPDLQRCMTCGMHGPLIYPSFSSLPTVEGSTTNLDKLVDCPWAAEGTVGSRAEGHPDKCLPPANKTLVRGLCARSANWKELLAEGGYPTDKQAATGAAITPAFIKSWCETCVNAVDWEVDMYTTIDTVFNNVDAMGILDWTAFVFAAYIVGLNIIGELKDMLLCEIAIERLGDKLGPWRHPIVIGIFLRRTLFLPFMLGTVGTVVVIRGGDSLSVCFNTVAILFMAEADNMAYHLGLSEPQKARMETDGRVALTTKDSQRLQGTKMVYLPVIIAGIAIGVMARDGNYYFMHGFVMMNLAEAVRVLLFDETKQKPKGVAMAFARFVFGVFFFVFTFLAVGLASK
jgi:hypothetical protein